MQHQSLNGHYTIVVRVTRRGNRGIDLTEDTLMQTVFEQGEIHRPESEGLWEGHDTKLFTSCLDRQIEAQVP